MRPDFTADDASALVKKVYGLSGQVDDLVSYSDQNFLVRAEGGDKYVLKITNSAEPVSVLRFQQGALSYLEKHAGQLNCPVLIPRVDGETLGTVDGNQGTHVVWMVGYQPGQFVSQLSAHSQALQYGIGAYLGQLDAALEGYTHEAMHRVLPWDLMQAEHITERLKDIDEPDKKQVVQYFLGRFINHVLPRKGELRRSVIHNDANDNNLLTENRNGVPEVYSIIDFGDMVYTATVSELAIGMAYMILGKEDIMGTVRTIARGYHAMYPITEEEIEVVFDLVCIRLCISVCMSARERKRSPDNTYLAISEAPAWAALARLRDIDPDEAMRLLREALVH